MHSEIIFKITAEKEGGYSATAMDYGITTQAETLTELRKIVLEAVECFFDNPAHSSGVVYLNF